MTKKAENKKEIKVDESRVDAFDQFVEEFRGESDRAAVILGTAKLDYLLYQLISKYLIPNAGSNDELLDGDSPLSTLSSRINICYRLGVIDSEFARALHLIRKIRNSFAHEVSGAKLDSGPHRDRIKALVASIADTDLYSDIRELYFRNRTGPTADFLTTLTIMAVRLETMFIKIEPISSAKAFPIVPSNYVSILADRKKPSDRKPIARRKKTV